MSNWLLLFKSIHIIGVIAWMAGLLYLYRLYVYHRSETEPAVMERFRVMERRLWLAITVPAAWVAVLAGLAMLFASPCAYLPQGWMTLKLVLVVWLLAVHFMAGEYRKEFLEEPFPLSEKAFRVLNEVPTVLMIAIVLLVVFRPYWWLWPLCG